MNQNRDDAAQSIAGNVGQATLAGGLNGPKPDIGVQSQLIQEALVKRIRDADRWSAVTEAWEALLKVQRMEKDMRTEREFIERK